VSASISRDDLKVLFEVLSSKGYELVGPRVRHGAVVLDEIISPEDLPVGWTDHQDGGTYRLKRRPGSALFTCGVGQDSWKKFFFPPVMRLWNARRSDGGSGFEIEERPRDVPRYAFMGVRPCDLRAIAIQDRIMSGGDYSDPVYTARREKAFVIAVNCTQPCATCFCHSMGSGPRAFSGFDLALTEVIEPARHFFVAEAGSVQGREVLSNIPHSDATVHEIRAGEERVMAAAELMGRRINTNGIGELLKSSYEHPRWQEIARRCLSCGNCTLVCPTCFCTVFEDYTDLSGDHAHRLRSWDSCFTKDFSYIHGGSVRVSTQARYRQWMIHKLATWLDQFSTSGCVGCGRCITWCPVGIDISEEARIIRGEAQ
jgi:sulfhydrogenase subunit beta (sulfur reductase)